MSELAVTGLEVVCPVGLTAQHACAALRAGVVRLARYEDYLCLLPEGPAAEAAEDPEPVVAGCVPILSDEAEGPERLLELARRTLQGLIAGAGLERKDVHRTALLVALPAPDPVVATWRLGETFAKELCRRTGVSGWVTVELIEKGPAGVLTAVEKARALLAGSRAEFCVVMAADTLISADRLTYLDERWRLRSLRSPDGLLPGEASAALLLESRRTAGRRKAHMFSLLGRVETAHEPVTIEADRWSTGSGLYRAMKPLLEGADGAVGRYMLCNLNGEAYRAHEWGLVQVRLARDLPPIAWLFHPAEAIGDAGAGLAGVLVACACMSFNHGYAPAHAALVWVGSDDGSRAAMVIRAPSLPA